MDWFLYDKDLRHERVKNLSDFSTINDKTLSLLHVNVRRLTVSTTLEQVLQRWDDAKKKKYFLEYVLTRNEYKNTLPLNSKC